MGQKVSEYLDVMQEVLSHRSDRHGNDIIIFLQEYHYKDIKDVDFLV